MTPEIAARSLVAACDLTKDFVAPRVGQGFRDAVKLLGSHGIGVVYNNYIIKCVAAKATSRCGFRHHGRAPVTHALGRILTFRTYDGPFSNRPPQATF